MMLSRFLSVFRRPACRHSLERVSFSPSGFANLSMALTCEREYRQVDRCVRCGEEKVSYWGVPRVVDKGRFAEDGYPLDDDGNRLPACLERPDYDS